jgi:hypothetical protein
MIRCHGFINCLFYELTGCSPYSSLFCFAILNLFSFQITGRPSTPGSNDAVYGIIMRKGTVCSVIGTAFSVSSRLAISASHNFTDNLYDQADSLYLCKEINQGVFLADSPMVSRVNFNSAEDWAILELLLGFQDFHNWVPLCPENQLPNESEDAPAVEKDIGIRDFPSGLIDSMARVTIGSMTGKLYNYCAHSDHIVSINALQAAHSFPQAQRSMLNIRGGRELGSCGAPYFAANGKVVAFHVGSVNDSDTADTSSASGHSHASYSRGHVLCRLTNFTQEYPHLFA